MDKIKTKILEYIDDNNKSYFRFQYKWCGIWRWYKYFPYTLCGDMKIKEFSTRFDIEAYIEKWKYIKRGNKRHFKTKG